MTENNDVQIVELLKGILAEQKGMRAEIVAVKEEQRAMRQEFNDRFDGMATRLIEGISEIIEASAREFRKEVRDRFAAIESWKKEIDAEREARQ
jgi:hypothetical protein